MLEEQNYIDNRFSPTRRKSLEVSIGEKKIGAENPILIQSMTTTNTQDIKATAAQTLELARAGCELVRITTPTVKDSKCLEGILKIVRSEGCGVPICADIHFQPKAAFEAVKWVEKVRINPGNFVDTKTAHIKEYDEAAYQNGIDKIYDTFSPLVREAKKNGAALRIGTNHGSLSDRILYRHGDTVQGMVESALEYLKVCEDENFEQVVFSMKASNPRVVIQAYRLLALSLKNGHKNYPFHIGVTEAGDGEDGRLKSAVGIGALLLDGLGDTVRVSLTEDPVYEIPVAQELVSICQPDDIFSNNIQEDVSLFDYRRRETEIINFDSLKIGGKEKISIGVENSPDLADLKSERKPEWIWNKETLSAFEYQASNPINSDVNQIIWNQLNIKSFDVEENNKSVELSISDVSELDKISIPLGKNILWSIDSSNSLLSNYRYLGAWLSKNGYKHNIILKINSDGSAGQNMYHAAVIGSLLCDGIGDTLLIEGDISSKRAIILGFDLLQAASARRSKTEYVSCPSCGRTLFDLESTTQKIRVITSHLKEVSIAIMGCIVNGPGEMADADFGYVGGAPNSVNLYVGRDCVKKNIPESEAPEALVKLIKEHGKWKEPAA